MDDLLFYNKKNYQWDGKLRAKREFQEQDVRLRQFTQYREDIRDLQELTCGKMDVVLLLDCLMLDFTVLCLVKGHYEKLEWLLWLEFMSLTSAALLLFVSAYLAMQCSVAAHSFSVRLLTQFLRLPVASVGQLDAAVAKARDFEKSGNILRLPFLRTQVHAALDEYAETFEDGIVNVASLDHVKLFRRMQANFMAYDAYARAGTTLGANQLLYGLFYKLLGLSFIEDHSLVLAVGGALAFGCLTAQVKNVDLRMGFPWNGISNAALVAPLILSSMVMAFREHEGHELFLPIVFALHCLWVALLLYILQPDDETDIQLPTKFKQVLFLDVFGFTSKKEQNVVPPSSSPYTAPPFIASSGTDTPVDTGPPPEVAFSPFDAPSRAPSRAPSMPASSPVSRRPSLSLCRLPPEEIRLQFAESLDSLGSSILAYMGDSVQREFPDFYKRATDLREVIQKWKITNGMPEDRVSFVLLDMEGGAGPLTREPSRLLEPLRSPGASPPESRAPSRSLPSTRPGSPRIPVVSRSYSTSEAETPRLQERDGWLFCPADPSVYYFRCATGETSDSLPPHAEVLPSLDDLDTEWQDVQNMWNQLVEDKNARKAEEEKLRAREKDSELRRRLCSSVDDEKAGKVTQEERFGGREGVMSSYENAAASIDHTVGIGATFHPEEVKVTTEGNTVPGRVPWHLFKHASQTLFCLWAIGTLWAFIKFTLGHHIIYPPYIDLIREPLHVSDVCRTEVISGAVLESGHIVSHGNWSVAAANEHWKVLGTPMSVRVGTSWAQAEENTAIEARNVTSLAVGRDRLWSLSPPSLITVYSLPSLQPLWDFRYSTDVTKIFSVANELGVMRRTKGACSATMLDDSGYATYEYRLRMAECRCRRKKVLPA